MIDTRLSLVFTRQRVPWSLVFLAEQGLNSICCHAQPDSEIESRSCNPQMSEHHRRVLNLIFRGVGLPPSNPVHWNTRQWRGALFLLTSRFKLVARCTAVLGEIRQAYSAGVFELPLIQDGALCASVRLGPINVRERAPGTCGSSVIPRNRAGR